MQRSKTSLNNNKTAKSDQSQLNSSQSQNLITSSFGPLHLDSFIPWVCEELVTVVRGEEENNIIRTKTERKTDKPGNSKGTDDKKPFVPASRHIELRTIYAKSNLVEISIIAYYVKIPVKVIRAISMCLPFYPTLTRLTIRRGGNTAAVVAEISNLLQFSNITNVCLDDSIILEGNYEILLQETTQLTYLSLNRCRINDEICKRITMSLHDDKPAAKNLRALDLASNSITDEGVRYFGTMLRSNRTLMHLNLAGNMITDDGGIELIVSLKEFRLTDDEALAMKQKRLTYLKNRLDLYNTCLEERHVSERAKLISNPIKTPCSSRTATILSKNQKEKCQNDSSVNAPSLSQIADEFIHPHSPANTVKRNGFYFCKGNFVLCSLNLAYNSLHYPFLKIIHETVAYQKATAKSSGTGLIRVVLDGNNLPINCEVADQLECLLTIPFSRPVSRTRTLSKKIKSRTGHLNKMQ